MKWREQEVQRCGGRAGLGVWEQLREEGLGCLEQGERGPFRGED